MIVSEEKRVNQTWIFIIFFYIFLNEIQKKTKIDLSWQFSSISLHIVIIISIIKYIIAFFSVIFLFFFSG